MRTVSRLSSTIKKHKLNLLKTDLKIKEKCESTIMRKVLFFKQIRTVYRTFLQVIWEHLETIKTEYGTYDFCVQKFEVYA